MALASSALHERTTAALERPRVPYSHAAVAAAARNHGRVPSLPLVPEPTLK